MPMSRLRTENHSNILNRLRKAETRLSDANPPLLCLLPRCMIKNLTLNKPFRCPCQSKWGMEFWQVYRSALVRLGKNDLSGSNFHYKAEKCQDDQGLSHGLIISCNVLFIKTIPCFGIDLTATCLGQLNQ